MSYLESYVTNLFTKKTKQIGETAQSKHNSWANWIWLLSVAITTLGLVFLFSLIALIFSLGMFGNFRL